MKTWPMLLIHAVVILMIIVSISCGGEEEAVFTNDDFEYHVDLEFTWPSGKLDVLQVDIESPSKVTFTSKRLDKCELIIESETNIAHAYTAEEYGVTLETVRDTGHSYVFPNGLIPAYAIRGDYFKDVIVTDDYIYVLTRPRNPYWDDELRDEVDWFGEEIINNFYLDL